MPIIASHKINVTPYKLFSLSFSLQPVKPLTKPAIAANDAITKTAILMNLIIVPSPPYFDDYPKLYPIY